MITNDYTCRDCGNVIEIRTYPEPVIDEFCPVCKRQTRWDKKYSAPHLGSGSNGEPPR